MQISSTVDFPFKLLKVFSILPQRHINLSPGKTAPEACLANLARRSAVYTTVCVCALMPLYTADTLRYAQCKLSEPMKLDHYP